MRSSLLSLVYFIFLATTIFIVFASLPGKYNTLHNHDYDFSDLEALYAENDIILSDLMSMKTNTSKGPSSTLKPTDQNCVCDNNPAVSGKKSYEIVDFEVRESLYKLFHTQVSKAVFDLRNFEIEGWPEGVDRIKPRWNLKEVLRIRQNLRNFKFIQIPRFTTKKQFGADAFDLDFDYDPNFKKSEVFEKLLQKYRTESKNTDAIRIDWKQLDRSQIPPKYDSVPINGRVMTLEKYFRCPEIVDNIHFYPLSDLELLRKSLNRGVKYKKIQVANELELSEDEKPSQLIISDEEFEELLAEIMMSNYESSSSDTRKRKFEQKEDNEAYTFDIWPTMNTGQDFSLMKPSEETSSTSLNDIQSFHSDSAPSSTGKTDDENADFEIRETLYKVFGTQVPGAKFDLRNYDIEGWPEGINRLKQYWNSVEVFRIRQNMKYFKFKPISTVTFAEALDTDVSDMNFSYDPNLKKVEVFERLRKRYRIESRHNDALYIDWKQLDRSKIPSKYDNVPINGRVMTLEKYFRCPEIVDNIHFHPLSDLELLRKSLNREASKDIYAISRYKKLR